MPKIQSFEDTFSEDDDLAVSPKIDNDIHLDSEASELTTDIKTYENIEHENPIVNQNEQRELMADLEALL